MAHPQGITIFREKDAPGLFESGTMSFPVFDAAEQWAELRANMSG